MIRTFFAIAWLIVATIIALVQFDSIVFLSCILLGNVWIISILEEKNR